MNQPHISLFYDDIDNFVANVAADADPSITRSLTLRVSQPTLASYQPEDVEKGNARLEDALLNLSNVVPSLGKLQSFSLTVSLDSRGHHLDISQRAIATIIVALPNSCVNLELDTAGLDHATGFGTPVHLCDTLRKVLPRMRHVRISLRTMCGSLVGTTRSGNTGPSFTPISLPNIENTCCQLQTILDHRADVSSGRAHAANSDVDLTYGFL